MNEQDCEQLMLYQEDSRANLFPWPESNVGKRMTATSGLRCFELSENLNRITSLVRMYLESCELPGERFVRTWSVKDTLSPFLIMKLRLSEQSTDEKECSLWRTPAGSDGEGGIMKMYLNKTGHYKLRDHVQEVNKDFWPTSTTPRPHDNENTAGKYMPSQNQKDLAAAVASTGGQLNPTFVEWLMGFPRDWTEVN
jgi:hypothetical protein